MKSLSPLFVFLLIYVTAGLVSGDFYSMPVSVAFLLTAAWSVCIMRETSLEERINILSKGACNQKVMLMVWMFVLAGAFASGAQATGALQTMVDFCLNLFPTRWLVGSLFVSACVVSLAVGTSVGTVAAIGPIAVGVATEASLPLHLALGAIVGGAMFGDNLSAISDTTIVATRTQGCKMNEKFRANFFIALPAALLVLAYYLFGLSTVTAVSLPHRPVMWPLMLPYIIVLFCAVCGMHVLLVLSLGIVATGVAALLQGTATSWFTALGTGITGMGDLITVSLLAAGIMGVVQHLGGIDLILNALSKRITNRRAAECVICLSVFVTCLCTANNTIGILANGTLARAIAQRYDISPARAASLLDIASCVALGILPWGAFLLMASTMGNCSPLDILPFMYYPTILAAATLLSIIFKKQSHGTHSEILP